jgi:hypothetical protein
MDIVSHGLWGSIAFGRKSRSSFWLAFVIGMAPDLFSFGILWVAAILGLSEKPDFSNGTPPESTIPQYVHYLYNATHSFIVFLAVFFLVWFLLKRPLWELAAWGLHVLVDVPTHSYAFFPTPVLWPLFNWKFNGWQWMTPTILIPTLCVLSLLYGTFIFSARMKRKERQGFAKAGFWPRPRRQVSRTKETSIWYSTWRGAGSSGFPYGILSRLFVRRTERDKTDLAHQIDCPEFCPPIRHS